MSQHYSCHHRITHAIPGMHDLVGATMSKNTSFHVTSALATWKYNSTSDWIRSLSAVQQEKLVRVAVKKGVSLKRQTDFAISEAAVYKLKRLKKDAEAKRKSDKKLIHELLKLRNKTVFKTVEQYELFCNSVNHDDKKIMQELRMQIRLLNKVFAWIQSMTACLDACMRFTHQHTTHRCMAFHVNV